jgi:Protein of unknown function (DUF2892).
MQMTPSTRRMISFMSGPWGRGLRIVGGIALWAVAIAYGGWAWLLAIPGTMMLITGVINYGPVGLMTHKPTNRSQFMVSLKPVNLLNNYAGHNVHGVTLWSPRLRPSD